MSKEQTTPGWREMANKKRIRSIIGNEIVGLIEVYNNMPVAQLLVSIIRSRGKVQGYKPDGTKIYRDPYSLTDAELLKELEACKEELQKLNTEDED